MHYLSFLSLTLIVVTATALDGVEPIQARQPPKEYFWTYVFDYRTPTILEEVCNGFLCKDKHGKPTTLEDYAYDKNNLKLYGSEGEAVDKTHEKWKRKRGYIYRIDRDGIDKNMTESDAILNLKWYHVKEYKIVDSKEPIQVWETNHQYVPKFDPQGYYGQEWGDRSTLFKPKSKEETTPSSDAK